MGIPLGHDMCFVSEESLDQIEIHAVLDQPGGEGVTQIVKPYIF